MKVWMECAGRKMHLMGRKLIGMGMRKEPGIDGILVTVGLCIIALLLCVVMKDSLKAFIETIVNAMTSEAQPCTRRLSGP